jgi:PAS domain S-box-containing protein
MFRRRPPRETVSPDWQTLSLALLESTPAAIAMFDRDMRYLAVTKRFRDVFRLGDQPLVGRSHYDVIPDTDRWRKAHRHVLDGIPLRTDEQLVVRPDGRTEWVKWEMQPWRGADGGIGGIILITDVITGRKQVEQATIVNADQLRQTQKMEAIGQLTGGIAHDFNNILGIIIGNVEFLRDSLAGDPEHAEIATEILNTALTGADLTRRLLAFARKQALEPRPIDLKEYIASLAVMLRRTLGETIRITTDIADDTGVTIADQAQIAEALLNLAINARDAMTHGGDLTISVANAHFDAEYAASNTDIGAGDFVMLSVSDTGTGMSSDVIERAFEPFFTTKPAGHGTGLGLSMIYGFARQSRGHVTIHSELGVGTTVRLYLPRVSIEQERPSEPAPSEPVAPRGSESILLVDDNESMRAVALRHLAALGYSVTSVESGPAALAELGSDQSFDLLFTDIVMPEGMSGYDLAEIATRQWPHLKVLFTTGYTRVHESTDDTRPLLQKPYLRQELARQIRAALDDDAPPAMRAAPARSYSHPDP